MWNQKDIENAFQKISKRAMTDKSFRELCLKNPAQAIKEATGKELPAEVTIKFVENQGADATFVLPNFKANPDELNEKELDAVAGGKGDICGATCGGSEACFFSSIF
ncbi:MAG: NHLP leader peptide family RiPP precursor [Bacteroidota bacterium]